MKLSKNFKKIIKPWKVLRSRYVLSDRWLKVRADDCVTSDGTKVSPYYVLEKSDWVHMVVVNKQGQVLITEQYRHGAGKIGYEIPCGTIDAKDKNPLDAAKRELLEETGYEGDFCLIGSVSPNPANHANKIFIFLVTNPIKRSDPKEDSTEVMNCEFIYENKAWKLIEQGKFQHALCISSLVIGLKKKNRMI